MFNYTRIFPSSNRLSMDVQKLSLFIYNKVRISSAQNSATETDISNILSCFINTGFPLHLEHQVRSCTKHTHTQSLVDYVALCTCTTASAVGRRSTLSRPSPDNFILCDDLCRCLLLSSCFFFKFSLPVSLLTQQLQRCREKRKQFQMLPCEKVLIDRIWIWLKAVITFE